MQILKHKQFQSTLLQEERLVNFTHIGILNDFNPRSYKRSDSLYNLTIPFLVISIHAPTRGATSHSSRICVNPRFQSTLLQEERRYWYMCKNWGEYFNPRSYKRSDIFLCCRKTKSAYFNPRSYKRSDRKKLYKKWCDKRFQSTLLQEERLEPITLYDVPKRISIHAPTRGATSFHLRNCIE